MKTFLRPIAFIGFFLLTLSGGRVPASTRVFEAAMETVCEAELPQWGTPQTKVRVDALRQLALLARKHGDDDFSRQILQRARTLAEKENNESLRRELLERIEAPLTDGAGTRGARNDSLSLNEAVKDFMNKIEAGDTDSAYRDFDAFACVPENEPLLTALGGHHDFPSKAPTLLNMPLDEALERAEEVRSPRLREFLREATRRTFILGWLDRSPSSSNSLSWGRTLENGTLWNDPRFNRPRDFFGDYAAPDAANLPKPILVPDLPARRIFDLVDTVESPATRLLYAILIANRLLDRTLDENDLRLHLERLDRDAFDEALRRIEKALETMPHENRNKTTKHWDNDDRAALALIMANLLLKADEHERATALLRVIEDEVALARKNYEEQQQAKAGEELEEEFEVFEVIVFDGEPSSPVPRLSYGNLSYLAATYLKAGDTDSYQRLMKERSDRTQPTFMVTCPVRTVYRYEMGGIFCDLDLFDKAVRTETVPQYSDWWGNIRLTLERNWRRAAATGDEAGVLETVRELPGSTVKVVLLDEIAKLLRQANRSEEATSLCREILAGIADWRPRRHPYVQAALEEDDPQNAWNRVRILLNSFPDDGIQRNLLRNFSRTCLPKTGDLDIDRARRHAGALCLLDLDAAALALLAAKLDERGRTDEAGPLFAEARLRLGKTPEFQYAYPKSESAFASEIKAGYARDRLVLALLERERFDEAVAVLRESFSPGHDFDHLVSKTAEGLCLHGRPGKALDLIAEFADRMASEYWALDIFRHFRPELSLVDAADADRAHGFLLARAAIYADLENDRFPSRMRVAFLRHIAESLLIFGDRDTALACYRNAVAVIRNDPEPFSYGLESRFLAEKFQKHFGCEEAEEAFCLSILSRHKGRVDSDFSDVLRRVESFLLLREQEKSGPPPEEKQRQDLRTKEERIEYWHQSVSSRF